jgi:hypothetical protein
MGFQEPTTTTSKYTSRLVEKLLDAKGNNKVGYLWGCVTSRVTGTLIMFSNPKLRSNTITNLSAQVQVLSLNSN